MEEQILTGQMNKRDVVNYEVWSREGPLKERLKIRSSLLGQKEDPWGLHQKPRPKSGYDATR